MGPEAGEDATEPDALLAGVHVIDGGLASELAYQGAAIDGPLWSARALEDAPATVIAVHRAYLEAGAQCIASCSYQVSRMGYAAAGLAPERADTALLQSVALARAAAAEFPGHRALVSASLGPYGAALHNGAEYTGEYGPARPDLVRFHRERIAVLAGAAPERQPDLLAFETIPSLEEARAIVEALGPWPGLAAWFSFSCRDEKHVSHGETVAECAAAAAARARTVAVGVNCVPPALVPGLIAELRAASAKPVLVYPNAGEGWDAASRRWTGAADDPADFGRRAAQWFRAGARIVGGCCRTRPAHIRAVAAAAERRPRLD